MSALLEAGQEFLADEERREKRGQRTRMDDRRQGHLAFAISTLTDCRATVGDTRGRAAMRGHTAVELFGYRDTFDEKAATTITDILHAAAAKGHDPQQVLNQAAAYYAEEVEPELHPVCDVLNERTGWRCTLRTGKEHAPYLGDQHLTVIDGERFDWLE